MKDKNVSGAGMLMKIRHGFFVMVKVSIFYHKKITFIYIYDRNNNMSHMIYNLNSKYMICHILTNHIETQQSNI